MFNKSRMTISKLLRPESIAKIQALAAAGVRLEAKRCRPVRHPEVERRVYAAVGKGTRLTSKAEIFRHAQDIVVPTHAPQGPRQLSTTSAPSPRPRGAHAHTAGSAPIVNRQRLVRHA